MADASLSLSRRPWDILYIAFFALHIPTTVLLDSQVVLPRRLYPQPIVDLLDWHIRINQDFLCGNKPRWFVALCAGEVVLQLPYFFVAIYAFVYGKEWIRVPSIIYAAHVVTTMIPILSEIALSSLALPARLNLLAVYLPYLLIPLGLLFRVGLYNSLFTQSQDRVKSE